MKREKKTAPPLITSVEISGKSEVLICLCRGLLFYSSERIETDTPLGEITVCGERLTMRWAGDGKLLICGIIRSVNFM